MPKSGYDGRCGVYGASSEYDDDSGLSYFEAEDIVNDAIAKESRKNDGRFSSIESRLSSAERNNKLLLNELVTLRLDKMEERLSQLRKAIPIYPIVSTRFNLSYM